MISFKILTKESMEELLEEIRESAPDADLTFAEDNMRLFLEHSLEVSDGEIEYAISYSNGCLLFRIYEEEYSFMYPLPLFEGADTVAAALEIRAYAVKEEIPLIYTDVRATELGDLIPHFRHLNLDAQDKGGVFYTVRVMSEPSLLDEIPEFSDFLGHALTPFTPEDDEDYARLCMDKESNQLWGYDYSEDEPDPEISYFRECAEGEFYNGTALCLAFRVDGKFVGEGTLYYFDLMGGCQCAARILPEYRRRGYGTAAVQCLKSLAKRMGIVRIGTRVDLRNTASLKLTDKCLHEIGRDDTCAIYELKL